MSENLDLVRSICVDWERGDYRSGEWADPGVEFVMPDGPEAGSWAGVANMARVWFARLAAWEDFRAEAEEYRELDDERLLVLDVRHGRGKTSGLDLGHVGTNGANLFHIRDGKVTRLVTYFDRARALADLCLEE
jgi:ketosteroid isomerase-like protein